jgi:hypothetical protein
VTALIQSNEAIRLNERKRLQQQAIHDAEDRSGRADTKTEAEDREQDEAGA